MKTSGVYMIRNLANGKVYIGSSIDTVHRMRVHRTYLRGNYHDNPYLQKSWNKYGEEHFEFQLLETCPPDELIDREVAAIARFKSNQRSRGYNIGDCVVSPMRGRKHSAKTKQKLSERFSGKGNPNYGKSPSELTRVTIAQSLRDYYDKNPMTFSDETKAKISDAQRGEKNHMHGKVGAKHHRSQKVQQLSMSGDVITTFESITLASKALGISSGNLSRCCNGKLKSVAGFLWRKI